MLLSLLLLSIPNCDNRKSKKGEMLLEPGYKFTLADMAINGQTHYGEQLMY